MSKKANADSSYSLNSDDDEEFEIEKEVEEGIRYMENFDEKVQAIAINSYLLEKRALDEKKEECQNKIDYDYRQQYGQELEEINRIIEGKYQFTDIDFIEMEAYLTGEQMTQVRQINSNFPIKHYWYDAITNSDVLSEHIQSYDKPVLKYLKRIQASKCDDMARLRIKFYFQENSWFNNQVILKEFQLKGSEILKSYGDQIEWKQGKNITIKPPKKKKKKKAPKRQPSFFNFFRSLDKSPQDEEDIDLEEEQIQNLEEQYEMAEHIYEDLVPRSLEYYLGVFDKINDPKEEEGPEQEPKEAPEQIQEKQLAKKL